MHEPINLICSIRRLIEEAFGIRGPLYRWHKIWNAEPIPLLSVPYPSLIRKKVPMNCWADKESSQLTHACVQPPDLLHQYKAFMCIKISVSDNNERNVQSGEGMHTLYTAIHMAFSLLETNKNTVKLYSIHRNKGK